jgi:hypothetical protein
LVVAAAACASNSSDGTALCRGAIPSMAKAKAVFFRPTGTLGPALAGRAGENDRGAPGGSGGSGTPVRLDEGESTQPQPR